MPLFSVEILLLLAIMNNKPEL